MALTNLDSCQLSPSASNSTSTAQQHLVLGNGAEYNIWAECHLVQVSSPGGFGDFGGAEVWISQYIQSGKSYTGKWTLLNLDNVSEVWFMASATNASVQAIGLVFSR